MSILKWLGLSDESASTVDSLAEIERALTELEPADARYLACFAFILQRVARADHVITDDEAALIQRLVAEHGRLSPERATLVARIAQSEHLRHGGTEDFLVTRQFARLASHEQKLALLDCLFAVSAADESIRTVEDNEIRRVASEIGLEHGDYIRVRGAHVHHLEARRAARPSSRPE